MKRLHFVLALAIVPLMGCTSQPESTPTSAPASETTAAFVAPTPSYAVEVTKDIEYVNLLEADAPSQKLDVYAPAEPGPWPVVVVMHGGYQSKDAAVYPALAKELAGRGLVVFVPTRRSLAATTIEAAQDKGWMYREAHESWACAVRYTRDSAADFGGEAERLTLFGADAASQQVVFAGDDLLRLWDELAEVQGGPPPQAECLSDGDTVHVDAFVPLSGDFEAYEVLKESHPALWELTSPYALMDRNPDLLIRLLQGEQLGPDQMERTIKFHEALLDVGYDATLTVLPDTRGEIPWSGPDRETLIQAILEAVRH